MYAVAFDLDTESLRENYSTTSPNNAYGEISRFLADRGFTRQQGSVYFGNATVNAVTCVLAITEMSRDLAWFPSCVRDIRMLRVEENNDLMPAVRSVAPVAGGV